MGVEYEEEDGHVAVTRITADSGAQKAGLKVGDYLLKVGDKKIQTGQQLVEAVRARQVGEQVAVHVKRGDKQKVFLVSLGKRPEAGLPELMPHRRPRAVSFLMTCPRQRSLPMSSMLTEKRPGWSSSSTRRMESILSYQKSKPVGSRQPWTGKVCTPGRVVMPRRNITGKSIRTS